MSNEKSAYCACGESAAWIDNGPRLQYFYCRSCKVEVNLPRVLYPNSLQSVIDSVNARVSSIPTPAHIVPISGWSTPPHNVLTPPPPGNTNYVSDFEVVDVDISTQDCVLRDLNSSLYHIVGANTLFLQGHSPPITVGLILPKIYIPGVTATNGYWNPPLRSLSSTTTAPANTVGSAQQPGFPPTASGAAPVSTPTQVYASDFQVIAYDAGLACYLLIDHSNMTYHRVADSLLSGSPTRGSLVGKWLHSMAIPGVEPRNGYVDPRYCWNKPVIQRTGSTP